MDYSILRKNYNVFHIDVHKFYDGKDIDKLFECLTRLKNKTLNIKNELVEKHKNIDKEFE